MQTSDLAQYIDHTNLKSFATEAEILSLCEQAIDNNFAAVCINPVWVPFAHSALNKSSVKLCSVIGFPLGATPTPIKCAETQFCLDNGANEIDMVINIGEAKAGNWLYVENEIKTLADLCHAHSSTLKVIFENCFLDNEEIISACKASVSAGADYVKTSTGFGTRGASIEDVQLMAKTVNGACKIKAAGGIKDTCTAKCMIEAGADRIGTSSGCAIIQD